MFDNINILIYEYITLQGAFSLLFVSERPSLSMPLLARLWREQIERLVADLGRRKSGAPDTKTQIEAGIDAGEKLALRSSRYESMPEPNLGEPAPYKENISYNINIGSVIGAKVGAEVGEKLALRPAESGAMPLSNLVIPLPCKENEDIIYDVNKAVAPCNAPGGGGGAGGGTRSPAP